MLKDFWKSLKEFFTGPSIKDQFDEIVLREEVKKKEPVVADYVPSHGSHAESDPKEDASVTVTVYAEPVHGAHAAPTVDTQITDAVTVEKPKKTRKKKEETGEAPVKKPRKKKSTPEA